MGFKTILEVIICGGFWRILWHKAQNPLNIKGFRGCKSGADGIDAFQAPDPFILRLPEREKQKNAAIAAFWAF